MVSAKLRAQALPPKKKKKQAPQVPETADEFLAAGVEEEEGGEKWRAGDIVKSSRFFTRALEHYQKGISRYPQNFDLAYNRARLQYDICQQPRLLAAFRTTANAGSQDLLQLALDWHEYALQLNRDDADLIFNVGQLYRDMAEREQEQQNDAGALEHLNRASEAFLLCAEIQGAVMASQAEDQIPDVPPGEEAETEMEMELGEGSGPGGEGAAEAEEDGQWATVVEPVTPASIYDTISAALQTVTSTLPLLQDDIPGQPSRAGEYHIAGERSAVRLQQLAQAANTIEDWAEQHPLWERELLVANFRAAFQDLLARQAKTPPDAYSKTVTKLFEKELPPAQWLADTAEADVNLNTTLAAISVQTPPGSELGALASIRWKHLTRALNSLTALSKLGADAAGGINLSMSTVHARRAESELLRRRLGELANGELHADARDVLAGNAEKFFRGARQLAERDGEESTDFHARETISSRLVKGQGGVQIALKSEDLERNLVEMVDEGLLSQSEAESMLS